MCAYVSVHVYIHTSAGTCIPQSPCKSQTRTFGYNPYCFSTLSKTGSLCCWVYHPTWWTNFWRSLCLHCASPLYGITVVYVIILYSCTLTWCSLSNKTANQVTLQNMLPSLSDKWPQVHCKWKGGFIQVWLDELLGLTGVTEAWERGCLQSMTTYRQLHHPPEPPLEVVKHLFILEEDKNLVSKLQDLPLELSSSFQERCSESNLVRSYMDNRNYWVNVAMDISRVTQ